MPYSRPTFSQLRDIALQQINASPLFRSSGMLRRNAMKVLGYMVAGFAYLHYAYQDWISQQAVPFFATDEYAQGWGNLIGVQQKAATAATGSITLTNTTGAAIDVPLGTQLVRSDGETYATTADVSVPANSTATVAFEDMTPGSAGNTAAGVTLALASAIAGITSPATLTAAITGGADIETPDAYRTRYLAQYASPPQGGAASDYVEWALQVPGVTRAWCLPNGAGVGTVIVYTMFDVSEAAHGGFPQGTNGVATDETRGTAATGDQLAVANYIYPLRPVTALVYSDAPVAQTVNFTVVDLGTANTTPIQNAITAALEQMFLTYGSAAGGTIYQNQWMSAISSVAGVETFAVTSPATDIVSTAGNLPVLGTITFSA